MHVYLMKKEPRPVCKYCNTYLTIKPLLLECPFTGREKSFYNQRI